MTKTSKALKVLVAVVDGDFESLLSSGGDYWTDNKIKILSGRTPERITWAIGRIKEGKNPDKELCPAFDTKYFGKITGRFGRGGGSINKAAKFVSHVITTQWDGPYLEELRGKVPKLHQVCNALEKLLRKTYKSSDLKEQPVPTKKPFERRV